MFYTNPRLLQAQCTVSCLLVSMPMSLSVCKTINPKFVSLSVLVLPLTYVPGIYTFIYLLFQV